MIEHVSVLLEEVIQGLRVRPKGRYIDATFGAGGHSKAIFDKLDSEGRLMVFDQDEDVWANVWESDRLIFAPANFQYLSHYMDYHGWGEVDGVLADLGVSSHHLDQDYRGFSFRWEGELDMRMNRQSGKTARDVVNDYGREELQQVFSRYGEVRNARSLAERMYVERRKKRIVTTLDLLQVVEPMIRGSRERYLAQVFQAIRIEVNDELRVLEVFLKEATERLRKGGVLAVIAFHSLEDRLVKRWMKNGSFDGRVSRDVFGNDRVPFERGSKLVAASEEELRRNPRARSARLRIAIKR